jgi:nitric oxide reductase NorQ protein
MTTTTTRKIAVKKVAPRVAAKPVAKRVAKKIAPSTKAVARVRKPAVVTNHPLAHLIKPKSWDERYIRREFEGMADTALMWYARKTHENMMLFGPTGPGKTSGVYAYSAERGIPVATIACHGGVDPNTVFGRHVLVNGNSKYIESSVTQIMRHGGIILLDEINFWPSKVAGVLYPAIDGRRECIIEEGEENIYFKLHEDCQFIATYNPGYEGTRPLNKALNNKFSCKFEYPYDRAIESKLIVEMPTLLEIADKLRAKFDSGDLETPCATNMLQEFQEHAYHLGVPLAELMFVNAFMDYERSSVKDAIEHLRDKLKLERDIAAGIIEPEEPEENEENEYEEEDEDEDA